MSHVLLVLLDIDTVVEEALERAYPEHLASRLGFPGFVTAQHLRLAEGTGPRHLAWYELATPDAATSPAYMSHPPDLTSRLIAEHGQLRVRAVYADADPTPVEPPAREILLLDAPPSPADAWAAGARTLTSTTDGAPAVLLAWPGAAQRHAGPPSGAVVHGLYR